MADVLRPISSKITISKEKELEKARMTKGKSMIALLVFILGFLEIFFGRKQLLETRGVFGGNVFINPARYILIDGEIKSNKS